MLLFLVFGSRGQWKDLKDRANSRINPEDCLHWRELLGLFISLTFDLIEEILEVASRQDYRECKIFFVFPSLSHCLKTYQKNSFPLNLPPSRRNLSINEPTFSCFKRPSTHTQDALENVFAQREIIFTHRLTLDERNSCPSRPTL